MRTAFLYFFAIISLTSCNDFDDHSSTSDNSLQGADDVYDLNKFPEITLEFKLADWNKLLQNYDLNPKNEKKVVSKFSYQLDNETIVLDSIGLKLRGNTSRRRPEGSSGQLHNPTNPDWHHCHFGLDFSKINQIKNLKV